MPLNRRHELKYLITPLDYLLIRERLRSIAEPDPHSGADGTYSISTLYFDDDRRSAERETDDGVDDRRKLRARIYRRSAAPIRFEIKEKKGHLVSKRTFPVTSEECRRLCEADGSFLLHRQEPAARELYLQFAHRSLRPRVVVDYRREAYVFSHGDVRITFDRHLSAGGERGEATAGDFLDGTGKSRPVLPDATMILEVKFGAYLPDHVRDTLQLAGRTRLSISKFLLCARSTITTGKEGLWTD